MTHPLKVHRQRLKSYSRIALLMKQRAMRCLWDSMKCKRNVDNSRLSINRHHISWLVYLSNLSLLSAKWLLFIRTINKSTLFQPETERMFAIHYERLIFMKPGHREVCSIVTERRDEWKSQYWWMKFRTGR